MTYTKFTHKEAFIDTNTDKRKQFIALIYKCLRPRVKMDQPTVRQSWS